MPTAPRPTPIDSSTNSARPIRCVPTPPATCCSTDPSTPSRRWPTPISRVRPSVHVTVPVLTLIGESDAPGLLDGYGPIDADTARRLAARAPSFTRILTHPVSGTVLDVDRRSYRPPADLERWLQVRDGTCRFPGCNRAARRSDIDHTLDWNDGERTAFDNLAHLCAAHHHLKHETSWSVRQVGRRNARMDLAGRPQTPDASGESDSRSADET